jgi:glycosyltransferase involved in cell wall biosynthesis
MMGEKDGGSIVNYYLLKKQSQIRPRDTYFGVPKVPEELDGSLLPWVNYLGESTPQEIGNIMSYYKIPLVNIFHMGRPEIEKALEPVHNVGGKMVLHQTVHWIDDDILQSNRLGEIDKIVAPTEYAKTIFNMNKNIPIENLVYIPHGVDSTRYFKHKTILESKFRIDKSKQKVILYSGRLSFWKGIHQIIPIMRKLIQEYNCVFIIRGSAFQGNNESMKLAYIFERLSTNNPNIIFLPQWQSPSFMEELFGMTDILLFNSAHEGFGVPLIEAMSSSAVPVATSIPNHIEILKRNGHCGMLLDPKVKVGTVNNNRELSVASSDQLYTACKWLLDNPDEARVMGERGVELVKEKYDLTDIAAQWLSLYDSMLDGYEMETAMAERLKLV